MNPTDIAGQPYIPPTLFWVLHQYFKFLSGYFFFPHSVSLYIVPIKKQKYLASIKILISFYLFSPLSRLHFVQRYKYLTMLILSVKKFMVSLRAQVKNPKCHILVYRVLPLQPTPPASFSFSFFPYGSKPAKQPYICYTPNHTIFMHIAGFHHMVFLDWNALPPSSAQMFLPKLNFLVPSPSTPRHVCWSLTRHFYCIANLGGTSIPTA